MTTKFITFLFPGLLTYILLAAGCGKEDSASATVKQIPVKTAPVIKTTVSFPVHTSGILSSPREMKLSFKIGGIIKSITVEEGDRVRQGQLLAELDKSEIEARLQTAQSAWEKAQRDFRRVENLYQDSVATLEQKQDAETGLKVAKSNLDIAEYNFRHSSIRAPSYGQIIKQMAEINELAESGHPIFLFASTEGAWIVRVGIPDREVVRIRQGDSARVIFDAYPSETFGATITEIGQAADPYTGTYEVELTLLPHKRTLIFGFVADVIILPSGKEDIFQIPIEALVEADGSSGTVFTINPQTGTAQKISVELNRILSDYVAVSHGLEGIQQVVTQGSPYLTEGAQIKIIE
jgi:multidrug efflux system membrane fusion protein